MSAHPVLLVALAMLWIMCVMVMGCSPRYKPGDCAWSDKVETVEKWQKNADHVRMIMRVGTEHYQQCFLDGDGRVLVGTSIDKLWLDSITHKAPCPEYLNFEECAEGFDVDK